MAKESVMTESVDTVGDFDAAIATGDTRKMVDLMAPVIEWTSIVDFNIQGRGPEVIMEKVFVPLMQEWENVWPVPSESFVDGSMVASLGRFACVHRATQNILTLHTRMFRIFGTEKSNAIVNTSIHWRSNR
jgi:hypothetical protein